MSVTNTAELLYMIARMVSAMVYAYSKSMDEVVT